MPRSLTDVLLDQLNAKRGLTYPQVGYTYFANVAGDGRRYRTVYTIFNANGGVVTSEFNHASAIMRCEKIRAAIAAA